MKKRAERRVRREATIVNDLLHLKVTSCDAQRLSKVARTFCKFRPNGQPAREKKHVMATGIKYCTSNQDALSFTPNWEMKLRDGDNSLEARLNVGSHNRAISLETPARRKLLSLGIRASG